MSNMAKLDFMALDITGKNYLSWVLDAEMHLDANGIGNAIKNENEANTQQKAKAMILLRHHLHEALKAEYLTVKDPLILWNNLKERYDHQRTVTLPKARYEWVHLRLQDFKSVSEYNSAMFRITSQLDLCGEKITDEQMLEKTFSTFHASNILLQQQYRERGFIKYSQLISCLLVAEQNNELLMKNHETRPTGTTPFPEVNVATHNQNINHGHSRGRDYGRGRGRGRGYGNGRGRGRDYGRGRGYGYTRGNFHGSKFKNVIHHQKWQENDTKNKNEKDGKARGNTSNVCYRCGTGNHWARICRTPKHLVELYQESLKGKGKVVETNLVYEDDKNHNDVAISKADDPVGVEDYFTTTHLDVSDFLINDV